MEETRNLILVEELPLIEKKYIKYSLLKNKIFTKRAVDNCLDEFKYEIKSLLDAQNLLSKKKKSNNLNMLRPSHRHIFDDNLFISLDLSVFSNSQNSSINNNSLKENKENQNNPYLMVGKWNHKYINKNKYYSPNDKCKICNELFTKHTFDKQMRNCHTPIRINNKLSLEKSFIDIINNINNTGIIKVSKYSKYRKSNSHNKIIKIKSIQYTVKVKYYCEICMEKDYNIKKIPKCEHAFCKSCINEYLTNAINNGKTDIDCPFNGCDIKLSKDFIFENIEEEERNKYNKFEKRNRINSIPGAVPCPYPNCESYAISKNKLIKDKQREKEGNENDLDIGLNKRYSISNEEEEDNEEKKDNENKEDDTKKNNINNNKNDDEDINTINTNKNQTKNNNSSKKININPSLEINKNVDTIINNNDINIEIQNNSAQSSNDNKTPPPEILKCVDFNHEFCSSCLLPPHPGENCKIKSEKEYQNWKVGNKVCPCPRCGIDIYKDEGCNHMTCTKCNYQFCWICMGPYSSNHYRNFLSPCYGKQFDLSVEPGQYEYRGEKGLIFLRILKYIGIVLAAIVAVGLAIPLVGVVMVVGFGVYMIMEDIVEDNKFIFMMMMACLGIAMIPLGYLALCGVLMAIAPIVMVAMSFWLLHL